MATPTGVFLSAVTSEFGRARDVVASDLRDKQYRVAVQEDFRQEGGTTLDKLDVYVRGCQAVVAIVGKRSGAFPSEGEAAQYAQLLPAGFEKASYTQWELILARHHDKRLFIYHATPECRPDQPEPSAEDRPDIQARLVEWLFTDLGRDRDTFTDTTSLQIAVLKADLVSVVGIRRTATTSDAGLDVDETKPPSIRRKSEDELRRLPPNRRPLVGREDELDDLLSVLGDRFDQLVMLVGTEGVGKRALLQELANSDDLPTGYVDGLGINPILIGNENSEELRQAIWESFYDGGDPSVVDLRRFVRDVEPIEALVFVPDIDATVEHLPGILEAMPRTTFCVSAREDSTRNLAGDEIPVDGLDDEAMLELFEDLMRSPVPDTARAGVLELCRSTDGNPGRIELLAKEARKAGRRRRGGTDADPLIAWVAGRGTAADHERDRGGDSAGERDALAVAHVVGTEIPREVLAGVAGSPDVIDDAVEQGRLEPGSPRYRLNPVLAGGPADDSHEPVGSDEILPDVLTRTVAWAATATHEDIYLSRAFVLRMMRWGRSSGHRLLEADPVNGAERARARWQDVIDLGMSAEPAMAQGGRHGAWDELLRYVQGVAQAIEQLTTKSGEAIGEPAPIVDDKEPNTTAMMASAAEALGWSLHERGSRALLRDELGDARVLLNESLRHREDEQGRELSRKNLLLVPLAIIPFSAILVLAFLALLIGAAPFVPFDDPIATVDITPDVLVFDGPGAPQPFVIRNVGDGTIWIVDIAIDQDDAAFTMSDDSVETRACREKQQIPRGQSCEVSVEATGAGSTALLHIDVTSRSGERDGDRTAVLVSGP